MSKKKLLAEQQAHRIKGAIALALLSAPTILSWERTISVDVLVEEVRTFLEIPKTRVKSILTAFKKAIAHWLPAGWVTVDTKKNCVTLAKNAEPELAKIAADYAFL